MTDDRLAIELSNDLREVPRVAERVESFCQGHKVPKKAAYRFNLALDEVLTNIITYGFDSGGSHQIEVLVTCRKGELSATVSDDGVAFDPVAQPAPDTHAAVEDRPIGGLGIHLLRKLTDEVTYRRDGNRNYLSFRARFAAADSS